MRSLVCLLAIAFGVPALSAPRTYDLKLEFRLNDKVEKNHIIVQEGRSKTVTDLFGKEKFFCEVAVNEKPQDGKAKMFIPFCRRRCRSQWKKTSHRKVGTLRHGS